MASSYNELMGIGSHSDDANIAGWWPMQDNTGNTVVADASSVGINGVLQGGDNTSAKADAGPNNYLTSALHFNGSDDYISIARGSLSSDNATWLAWLKADADPPGTDPPTGFGKFGEANASAGNDASHYPYTDGVIYNSVWRGSSSTVVSRSTVGNPTPALTSWRQICIKTTPGASGWKFRIDQSTIKTETGITGLYTSGTWNFGRSITAPVTPTYYYLDGLAANHAVFARHLSDAEEADFFAGPEPVNSVAPAISGTETEGQTLSVTTGTWGLASPHNSGTNGTITYSYQWTRSDDAGGTGEANIGGATSSTYTLTGADVGKFIRCLVRATNDGGFDAAADTHSDMSGEIAAVASGNRRRRLLICGRA